MAAVKPNSLTKRTGSSPLSAAACAFLFVAISACNSTEKTETQKAILTPVKHPETTVSRNYRISGDSVGNLRVGSSSDQVYEVLGKERLRKETYQQEGMAYTAIEVYHDSLTKPSLVLMMNCDPQPCVVRNIAVRDPRYHTSKGMGIGDTYGQLKIAHKTAYVGWGEGTFVAVAQDMPVTFELDIKNIGDDKLAKLSAATLPDSTKIKGLFMYNPMPRKPAADSLQQSAEQ